jgi:hypothetical protein
MYTPVLKLDISGPIRAVLPMFRYSGRLFAFTQFSHELVTLCLRTDELLVVRKQACPVASSAAANDECTRAADN